MQMQLRAEMRVLDLLALHHGHQDESWGNAQGISDLEHNLFPDSVDIAQSPVVWWNTEIVFFYRFVDEI